jgi:hypothetical protein
MQTEVTFTTLKMFPGHSKNFTSETSDSKKETFTSLTIALLLQKCLNFHPANTRVYMRTYEVVHSDFFQLLRVTAKSVLNWNHRSEMIARISQSIAIERESDSAFPLKVSHNRSPRASWKLKGNRNLQRIPQQNVVSLTLVSSPWSFPPLSASIPFIIWHI